MLIGMVSVTRRADNQGLLNSSGMIPGHVQVLVDPKLVAVMTQ